MRLLFAIPHYYLATRKRKHGSLSADPRPRQLALTACVTALHQFFCQHQVMIDIENRRTTRANEWNSATVKIVICTTQKRHLLAQVSRFSNLFIHREVDVQPAMLGFTCHEVLRDHLGDYDYYCYVEDDIIVHDACLFQKLKWFTQCFGDKSLLQPNRYELGMESGPHKVYIDGNLAARVTAPSRLKQQLQHLEGNFLNLPIKFLTPLNPHAGCFFLNNSQMQEWASSPAFLDHSTAFIGPLESAATLGILRQFYVYKPASECANFLEVHHFGTRFLSMLRKNTAHETRNAEPRQQCRTQ